VLGLEESPGTLEWRERARWADSESGSLVEVRVKRAMAEP
jgi:hypothetical protein